MLALNAGFQHAPLAAPRLETSSRNSEVIHAGLYYPQGSKKAQFCVQGKLELYEYCQSRSIPYQRCGKLIVATRQDHLDTKLPELRQKALKNGVDDTRILTQQDVRVLEPSVQSVGALWSPSTGVLDSHSFMLSLLADAEAHGATLALHSNLTTTWNPTTATPEESTDGIFLPMDGGDGADNDNDNDNDNAWLQCKAVINSAGLWSHLVAQTIHRSNNLPNHDSWTIPQQYFAKGNYFRLEGCKNPFQHLVYPLPEPGGLGVHATFDWSGQTVKFGPDVEWIDADAKAPEEIDLTPNPQRAEGFYEQVRKYWPELPDHSLVPDYAGIRPKLHHPSLDGNSPALPFHDFCIAGPEQHGVPGLIHLFGMESPGLTGSMAIGDYIAQQVKSWD
jgi:L-2-hydroxyglutarate oxidase LhgO